MNHIITRGQGKALEPRERKIIEAIRNARSIEITINGGFDNELSIKAPRAKGDIRKFAHDVAIAAQDYLSINGRGKL